MTCRVRSREVGPFPGRARVSVMAGILALSDQNVKSSRTAVAGGPVPDARPARRGLTCLTKASYHPTRARAAHDPAMSEPVARLRLSTVPARPHPAPKGSARPVGTPLTALGGFADARGASAAGLPPARTWLVVVELEDEAGRVGVGTAGFGNPAAIEVVRQLEPLVVGSSPDEVARIVGGDVPLDAEHRPARRRPPRDQRSRHRALGPARASSSACRSTTLLGGRMRPSLQLYASWLYATRRPRRAGRRGPLLGGAGVHRRQAAPPVRAARRP